MNVSQINFNAAQSSNFTMSLAVGDVRTITINWASVLQTGSISTSQWSSPQQGLTVVSDSVSGALTTVIAASDLSGSYELTNTIITVAGETLSRTITIVSTGGVISALYQSLKTYLATFFAPIASPTFTGTVTTPDIITNGLSLSTQDFKNIYKKKIVKVLPLRHTDFAAAAAAFSGSLYPQTFTIDTTADEIFVIGNAPGIVSVYTWSTGAYKRVFCIGSSVASEGAVIKYESGTRYLYVRASDSSLHKYNITTLPTNLTTVTETASYDIGVDRNFSYRNGFWTVLDRGFPLAQYRSRNRFIRYDDSFVRVGDVDFGLMQSGLIEDVTNPTAIPKIQGFSEGHGFFVFGVGGSFPVGTSVTPYHYQGMRIFDGAGNIMAAGLMNPETMIQILSDNGLSPDRVENEGVFVSSTNQIYSMTVTASSSTDPGITTAEGIVIFEEFSQSADAIDFSSAAVTFTGTDIRLLQSGLHPRSAKPAATTGLFDPTTGAEFTTFDQILDYMIRVNQSDFTWYTSSVPAITDINGATLPASYLCKIHNANNATFFVELKGFSPDISYRITGDSGSRIQTQKNTGTPVVIGMSAVPITTPATTNEETLATITVPAGMMGIDGRLRITTQWGYTNSANDKTPRVRFGGAAGTIYFGTVFTTTASLTAVTQIVNRGATNSQIGNPVTASATGSLATANTTSAINTAVAQDIVITGQKETSGESLVLESYMVELIRP